MWNNRRGPGWRRFSLPLISHWALSRSSLAGGNPTDN